MPRFFAPPPRPVHLLVIVDASGSMLNYENKVQEALQKFFASLAAIGNFLVTLVQFAGTPETLVHARPAGEVTFYYSPGGGTALWDAIGHALQAIDSSNQTVVCLVATDGEENSSRKFTQQQIYAHKQTKEWTGTWSFLWLNMQGSENHNAKALGIECLDFSRNDIADVLAGLASGLARSVSRMHLSGERRVDIRALLGRA